MNREQLSKYKKNKRDIENLDGIIAKLQERLDAVPVVSGKVTKSSDEFPYIEEHVQVRVEEPKAATALKMRIYEKEKRKDQLIRENEKVEKYIAAMPDGTTKDIKDTYVVKSLSAKGKNYDIIDPSTGEIFHFVPGTRIQNSQIFAGKGTKHPLYPGVAEGLSEQIGGTPSKWQHCKGHGIVDYYGDDRLAEVHWFQEETVGKVKFKVKRWEDED